MPNRASQIARYHDPAGSVPAQWEMYDLRRDPHERHNLAHPGHRRTEREEREYRRLRRKLVRVEARRLRPLASTSAARAS